MSPFRRRGRGTVDPLSGLSPRRFRTRRRRWVRRILAVFAAILLAAGGIAAWAANRYLVEHTKISDVAAYEARMAGSTVPDGSTTTLPSADTVVLEENHYSYGRNSIDISRVQKGTGDDIVTYYVADVRVADAKVVRSGFAKNKFGQNIIEKVSTIAVANNAIFAINGDYYGFRTTGIQIRNGVIFRDEPARTGLALYRDGTMRIYDEKSTTAQRLLDDGVWTTLSFGPALVDDGVIPEDVDYAKVDTNIGNGGIKGKHPRTGIGMIGPNHFLFIAVDGRATGYSKGYKLSQLARLFKDLGATVAYNLDGGGSTTMWFNGRVVNVPRGHGRERPTSDILYIERPSISP